jgi:uncharacterized protein (TIGR03437 family)
MRQMVSGPDGDLWFTATYFESNGVIGRMTTAGTITQYPIPATGCTPNVAGCPNLSGITVGFDGALWFAENQANKIGRITTSGSWSDYLVPSANFNGTWIDGPGPITLGPDGACWFIERTANKIGRIDTSGRFLEFPAGNAGSSDAITPGPDGALWFTEASANRIARIDTSGNVTEYFIPSASQFDAYPSGIVPGPDGALWFTESLGNNIGRITTAGTITEYPIPSGNAGAGNIVAGPDGALWFTESNANKIGRATTAGVVTEYAIPLSGYSPESITNGPDGALWIIAWPPNLVSSTDQIWQLVIGSPATISSINPNTVTAGDAAFTLTVNGTGFISGSAVIWSGSSLTTTYVNGTQLTAAVPANLIATAGSANITVLNPGGTVSNAVTFAINPVTPTLSINSLNPSSATAGGAAFTLIVNGSGFISGSAVRWNGSSLTTTYGSGTQLTASVSASLIATAGTTSVTVINPGGTISNALTFTTGAASSTPTITSLSPSSAAAGGSLFTLTVNGSGFVSGSAIQWNGSALSTTYLSGTQLSASVASNLIASAGSASITVINPGGAVSNAVTFTINSSSGGSLSIITASPLPAGKVGIPYSQALAASGGTTPYKGWAIISGSLPQGMALSTLGSFLTGLLNGVPTTPGTFTFTVQVTDNTNTTATKQFSLTITGGSISISANGIVNAASYVGGSVSPGELIAIFGSGLGPTTLVGLQLDSRGYVSTSLGGTQVLFDGVAAPMIYTQAAQVSVVVPYGVAGQSSTQVQVTYQGQNSNVVSVPVATAVPGIFTIEASGYGPGAIVNQDGTVNSANNPASAGSIVFVYGTGEGQTSPPGVDGMPDGSPTPTPIAQPVTATIGGVNAQVLYAGGVPGLVAGVLQVNVVIPSGVAAGNSIPIVITIGGKTTQANVSLAVGTSGSQGLSITSLSSQTPTALTPLYISTKGINPNAPATVQFSNNTGFSVNSQPIRIASDGTVVVAVPLYLDPVNRTTSSGQVSVTVTQGNQSTPASTINVQDLPAVSSYGTQPGQISHAFLVYETMLTARRINELQAYQALPGNTVDTSQALATLQTLLKAIIQVRSDVDRVSMNNALVISGGTLPNGLPLQFDSNSLDLMDRMIGLHLSDWAPAISSIATSSVVNSPQTSERVISPLQLYSRGAVRFVLPTLIPRFVHRQMVSEAVGRAVTPQASSGLTGIITAITNAANQISLAKATSDYYANDATAVDKGLAVAGGLGSLYGLITVSASDAAKAAGDIYGGLVSSAGLLTISEWN